MIDFRDKPDPTVRRLYREALEHAEGTPRAVALGNIQACELAVTQLLDGALMGWPADQLGDLADKCYDLLNDAYLSISPEGEPEPVVPA